MELKHLDSHSKNMSFDPYFAPYMKNNSRWITDLQIRPKTVKLLEETVREIL